MPFDNKSYFETQYLSPPYMQFLHEFYILIGLIGPESGLSVVGLSLLESFPIELGKKSPNGFKFDKGLIKGLKSVLFYVKLVFWVIYVEFISVFKSFNEVSFDYNGKDGISDEVEFNVAFSDGVI